ncbi:Lsr2 family protein [Streptomyces sp. ISL-98]|uniref:histone-like nucleoid-structuring protein Lsr2 n=1 Tax=Streptomyces sp. ISL-98 TaxID=2819192 RepID=UPI001BE7359B|nr:Lsr2 family protein [Streptomyces sp. ISL-98]MBT2510959.1 Lsr2 family protein [Streptomyces sp. ISL-98]
MVQRTVTIYTDDLTGAEGEGIATHAFSLDGIKYEVDLGPDNYQKLLDALGPFMGAGRKVGGGARRTAKRGQSGGPDAAKIREWAKTQGIEVSSRGRIPADLLERYQAAH